MKNSSASAQEHANEIYNIYRMNWNLVQIKLRHMIQDITISYRVVNAMLSSVHRFVCSKTILVAEVCYIVHDGKYYESATNQILFRKILQ